MAQFMQPLLYELLDIPPPTRPLWMCLRASCGTNYLYAESAGVTGRIDARTLPAPASPCTAGAVEGAWEGAASGDMI